MKKIITILSIMLILSTLANIYQYKQNTIIKTKENEVVEKQNNINRDCYIMLANYFVNSSWLEFDLPPVKNCLINDELKKPYELNWFNSKILWDLLKQKDKLSKSLLKEYIEVLKQWFFNKIETISYGAMDYSLSIINDKEFTKSLIEDSIISGINKKNLVFYMERYKKQWGNSEYLINILETIKWNLDDYPHYYDDDYEKLLEKFSN